eukprot:1377112-Amorphochlora_amoeboformis.AAC.1
MVKKLNGLWRWIFLYEWNTGEPEGTSYSFGKLGMYTAIAEATRSHTGALVSGHDNYTDPRQLGSIH